MSLRVVKYNGYNLDGNHNPIAYNPYILEVNNIVQRYNFYVVEEQPDEMVLIFGGMTRLILPFISNGLGWNCSVDWGDGVVQNFTSPTYPDHIYSSTGNYTVKITGILGGFNFEVIQSSYAQYLKEIIKIDNLGIKTLNFRKCINLTKIHDGVFDNFNKLDVTNLDYIFADCTALNYIPSYLFKDFTNVTSVVASFSWCTNLILVPQGILENCVKITSLNSIFTRCYLLENVPIDLFNSCTENLNFFSAFAYCSALKNLPSFNNCLKVTTFQTTFEQCISATGNAEELWLRTNPIPSSSGCFRNCTGLSNYAQIPNNWKL